MLHFRSSGSQFLGALARWGRPLAALTIGAVFAFQCYWLRDAFLLRKSNLLQQLQVTAEKGLVSISIQRFATTLFPDTSSSEQHDLKALVNSIHTLPGIRPTAIIIQDSGGTADAKNAQALISRLSTLGVETDYDSLLHGYLTSNAAPVAGRKLTVYRRSSTGITVYPRGLSYEDFNTTQPISTGQSHTTFQVHVGGLDGLVLRGMAGHFAVSALYLLLSAITMATLLRAASLNRRLLQSKATFTQNMTHELKTPISTLFVAAETLAGADAADDPALRKKYVGIIRRGLEQLSSIVDTILANARLQHGPASLVLHSIFLKALLEDVTEKMSLQIAQANAVVRLDGVPDEAVILADSAQMSHVFLNLIDNVLKYAGAFPIVTFTLKSSADSTVILVADNGPGIPRKHFEDVFQPYFRAVRPDVHDVKGYGLGLSLVWRILHLHRGSVRILCSDAGGTVLELKLPSHGT